MTMFSGCFDGAAACSVEVIAAGKSAVAVDAGRGRKSV